MIIADCLPPFTILCVRSELWWKNTNKWLDLLKHPGLLVVLHSPYFKPCCACSTVMSLCEDGV